MSGEIPNGHAGMPHSGIWLASYKLLSAMKDVGRKWHYPFHFKNKIIVRHEVGWGMKLRLRSREAN